MQLGQYWWKRLGEKKAYNSTVRKCALLGISLFGTATVTWTGVVSLVSVERFQSSTPNVKSIYELISIYTVIFGLIFGLLGIACLTGAGVILVRTLFATLRFRTVFGFSPPATYEGQKAIQLAVDRVLTYRAIDRQRWYSGKEKIMESIRANRQAIAECDNYDRESTAGGPIQQIGTLVTQLEYELSKLEKGKNKAERRYYKTRDAARNPSLPIPFQVKDSFKEYLPKK